MIFQRLSVRLTVNEGCLELIMAEVDGLSQGVGWQKRFY